MNDNLPEHVLVRIGSASQRLLACGRFIGDDFSYRVFATWYADWLARQCWEGEGGR